MKKDIIYIDVDDDIIAIIGKVKESGEKIVALVPPKRVGVLQSAVNLRLLQRTATQSGKRLVLITGNQALAGLAAAAAIPVARNLQSKPEIAEISALDIDDGDDVIDGAELPVGDHASQTDKKSIDDTEANLIKGIDVEHDMSRPTSARRGQKKKKSADKKVPNFNTFRKRLVLIVLAAVLLIAGIVWALFFAPAATIVITARTSPVSVNDAVKFGDTNSADQGSIKSVKESDEKSVKIDFDASGKKDVGEKAKGTVRFSSDSFSALSSGIAIPAGTVLTSSSGKSFETDRAVELSLSGNSDSVAVVAAERGESYNGATGSVSGVPSTVGASFVDATTGGTSKTVDVVTASDVQKARQQLVDQKTDDVKKELAGRLGSSAKVIEASFDASYSSVSSQPSVGGEASDGKAVLSGKVTYTLSGIQESDLREYLGQTLKKQMQDQTAQKIYDTGVDKAQISDFARNGKTLTVRISSTGQIGPTIEEARVKEQAAGKRYGEIRDELMKTEGINDVDVNFSFFWVRSVPSNLDKIKIEFDVQNGDS